MKRKIALFINLIGLVGLAYAGLWLYSWQRFNAEIDTVYAQASEKEIVFLGEKPAVTGFPFVPKISYTHGLRYKSTLITFPAFHVRGFPLPGRALTAIFPEGVAIAGKDIPPHLALDFLQTKIRVPKALPQSIKEEDLREWQQKDGMIDVLSFTLKRESMSATGMGHLSLDKELQPALDAQASLEGYSDFIDLLLAQKAMKPFPAIAAKALLNGLSQTNPQTGRQTVHLKIEIKNQILSAGPVQAVRLPKIVWDTRNQPAPHLQ